MKCAGVKCTEPPRRAKYALYKKDKTGVMRVLRRKTEQIEASMDKLFGETARGKHPYRASYRMDYGREFRRDVR